MSNSYHQVEVLTLRKGYQVATVVTDGARTRSFEVNDTKDHPNLYSAIAHLEAKGFSIQPDIFTEV